MIRRNRKGFTLMEVLVSIALIGILFTPMLSFFSHSTQMNIKVKNIQRANTVAQSVMEEIRSYATIEALASTYSQNTGADDKMDMTDSGYNNKITNIYKADGTFDEASKYYFVKQEIESDGKKYAARVEVDPGMFTGDPSKPNNKTLPMISSLGSENTAIAIEEEETRNKILEFQRLHFNATGINLDEDDIADKLLKTMKVEVSDEGKEDSLMVHVRVYSEYTLTSPITGCDSAQVGNDIYNGWMEQSQLKGIYIFYSFDTSNNGTRAIMQKLEVNVDYSALAHRDWDCDFTVYTICQGSKQVDVDGGELTMISVDDYLQSNPSAKVSLASKANIKGNSFQDDGNTPRIWTNFPSGDSTRYPKKNMDEIVEEESIQRLSGVKVWIYNQSDYDKADYTHPIVTVESTRGEYLE